MTAERNFKQPLGAAGMISLHVYLSIFSCLFGAAL